MVSANKILVTGASGFVGSHLIKYLLQYTNDKIVALVRNNYAGNLARLEDVKDDPRLKIIWKDLRDDFTHFENKEIGKVTHILHLAASSHVDRSIQNPKTFISNNVLGTLNLLEFMRLYNHEAKMIYFSTDEVFGPADPTPVEDAEPFYSSSNKFLKYTYREWDRYNSSNPYAASKAACEEICLSYVNTYRLFISITHTMNIIGTMQHPEKLLPFCVREILAGNKLQLHSNAAKTDAPTRFFIHTSQVCEALYFVLHNMIKGEKYNIVGQQELSSLQIAQRVATTLQRKLDYELTASNLRPGHDPRYALDGSKLKEMGFNFTENFDDLLEDTIWWYEQNPKYL